MQKEIRTSLRERHVLIGVSGLEDGIQIEQNSKANFVRSPDQALEGHDLLAIQHPALASRMI